MQKERSTRSYVYRIPLDDSKAMRKIRRLEILDSPYWIRELKDSEIPNRNAIKNWGVKFYESEEHFDYDTREIVGGTIPGLEEYRHSLDWKPHPETELLEMKYDGSGGSKIRGEQFLGTSDPRLPNYVPVEFGVPWTPNEIENIWKGEPVPDKMNYSHDPPEIPASEAREMWREELHWAEQDGFQQLKDDLHELMEDCNHDHVVKPTDPIGYVGYCEDCGKQWRDEHEFDAERDELTVVG